MRRDIPAWVWWVSFGWVVVMALVSAVRVYAFESGFLDLGFLVYGLDAIADVGLAAPVEPAGWSLLEDHFSPVLILLAPLSGLPGRAFVLVALQALAVGVTAPIVWRIIERAGLTGKTAGLAWFGYLTQVTLLNAVLHDVHVSVMAQPLVALMILGLLEDLRRLVVVSGVVLTLVREDLAVLVLIMVLVFVRDRRHPLVVPGLAAVLALVGWRLTAGGPEYFRELSYGYIDASAPLSTLMRVLEAAWSGGRLMLLAVVIAMPWVVFRGWSLRPLVVGFVWYAPLLASSLTNTKEIAFHYYAAVGLFAVWSLADHSRAAVPLSERVHAAGVALVLLGLLTGPFGFGLVLRDDDRFTAYAAALSDVDQLRHTHAALACVSDDTPVSMTGSLLALGRWDQVRAYPAPWAPVLYLRGVHGDGESGPPLPLDVDLVVLHESDPHTPEVAGLPLQISAGELRFYADERDPALERCVAESG